MQDRYGKLGCLQPFGERIMDYIRGDSREQELLLPERLEDYVGDDNPVRVIEEFVEKLDMERCGFRRGSPNAKGRPGYDPRDMLKLYLYGYMNRTRSSRMLEKACQINLEAIWLMRRLRPDFKTIAEFRRLNAKAFKQAFRQFTLLCRRLDLIGGEMVAIDGTQLKAVNSPRANVTRTRLQRMIKQADERLEEYLKLLDDEDARERGGLKLDRPKLREKIRLLEIELQTMEELDEAMEQAGVSQISETDPDSRAMAKNPRIAVGYNAQAACDEKRGLIVAQELTNDVTDSGQLEPMAREASEAVGSPDGLKILADKGYDNGAQIRAVEEDLGCQCHVPARKSKGGGSKLYSKDAFRYLKTKDAYRCPAGRLLRRLYRHEVDGAIRDTYANPKACQGCPIRAKCTRNERGRYVYRMDHDEAVERARRRMRSQPEIYKRRSPTVEKAFGSTKWSMGCENLLLKGLEKCRGEWSLMCLCYNIKRAITILGVKALVEALSPACLSRKSACSRDKTSGARLRPATSAFAAPASVFRIWKYHPIFLAA